MPLDTKLTQAVARPSGIGEPKHKKVAAMLLESISSGQYKPGDLLPSEPELCRHFCVSRHTVRMALRSLYEKGLILTRQGQGSVVQTSATNPRYTFTCDSMADLTQFATETSRRLIETNRLKVSATVAQWLGCEPGYFWWEIRTYRQRVSGGDVIAWTKIYVPDAFADSVADLETSDLPVFKLMEIRYGHSIAKVRQNFSVISASNEEANGLGIECGTAVMCVERRFFDERGGLLEVSRTVHPPDAYDYEITVRQVLEKN